MRSYRVRIVQVCAIAIAIVHCLRAQSPDERIQNLVVMIDGKLGDSPVLGAGIIFGTAQDRLYFVTANHVVRRGADQAKDLKAQLKWLPGEPQPAALLTTSDLDLDLAVLSVTGLARIRATGGIVPFDMLGDAGSLKPSDVTHTLGYPSGRPWDMRAGDVRRAAGRSIQFETPFLYPGNSGGALLNSKYELIGLVSRDEQPDGTAVAIDTVMDSLKTWGYTVSWRRSGVPTAGPLAPGAVNGGVSTGGTAASQRLPNFAGVWEVVESRLNGVVDPNFKPGRPIRITQNGSVVHIGNRDLPITKAGTVGYQTFAAGPSPGHTVSTEDQADLADTLSWRIEGETLVFETIFHYRNQYGGHPAGTDVRVMTYRRVADDSSGATPPAGAPCHIKDVVFAGRSGSVRDALAKVTIDSFGPELDGQAVRVQLDLSAGDPNHMLLVRRLETTAQPGIMNIPATLNINVRRDAGIIPPEEVNAKATTATIYVNLGGGKYACKADFPIRFQ